MEDPRIKKGFLQTQVGGGNGSTSFLLLGMQLTGTLVLAPRSYTCLASNWEKMLFPNFFISSTFFGFTHRIFVFCKQSNSLTLTQNLVVNMKVLWMALWITSGPSNRKSFICSFSFWYKVLWNNKGIHSFQDLFIGDKFPSFHQLRTKFDLPHSHHLRDLQLRDVVRKTPNPSLT